MLNSIINDQSILFFSITNFNTKLSTDVSLRIIYEILFNSFTLQYFQYLIHILFLTLLLISFAGDYYF